MYVLGLTQEKRYDSRRGDNREYLRGEKGWIQTPDGGDLGLAKSRDSPFRWEEDTF